jgi:polyvinyl alcohol dehydrogenase (cytochrome)
MSQRTHHVAPFESRPRFRRVVLALASLATLTAASQAFGLGPQLGPDWGMIGHVPANTRDQPFERDIGPSSVSRLASKWVATTAGDVSATPAVVQGAVYFPDFGGKLWKLDADTGAVIWSHSISEYTGIANDISRTSPSLAGKTLVIGDLLAPNMMGIDAKTGDLQWITQVHPHPAGIITGSPVLAGDRIYVGVSSRESSYDPAHGLVCCTFRGALVALDAQTGRIVWRTYGLPDNGDVPGGFAGAAIIAPPAVDLAAGLVYVAYGNLYTQPATVAACNAASPNGFSESCIPPGAYFKSLVALDLRTGEPRWSYRVQGHDPWLRACGAQPSSVTWCPAESDGEKWDVGGSGPNVFETRIGERRRDVVGFGEKSGVYVLFDAKTGEFLWNTLVGPGGDQGGMEWGTATDGDRIYVAITNHHHIAYTLTPSGTAATGGSWAALDPANGQILWQTGDPQGAWDLAPVTVANGVVYASSVAKTGNEMYALDAATGTILWQFAAGSSVNSGPAVVDGSVYWGSGYARAAEGNGNKKFYAFSLDGKEGK